MRIARWIAFLTLVVLAALIALVFLGTQVSGCACPVGTFPTT